MNTKNFGNGYVGIKINSISEIMKYNALKEIFSIWSDDEDTSLEDDVEVMDDDGNVTEREPTENEKIERILEAFNNGVVLYQSSSWIVDESFLICLRHSRVSMLSDSRSSL